MRTTSVIRLVAWAAIVALLIGAGGIYGYRYFSPDGGSTASTATIGGDFELVDGKGNRFTQANLSGKPFLIFFGFTYCPDVCPTTLSDMQGWIEDLGEQADDLNFVFVSVDPERDTPEVLSDYVYAFDPRIIALTGTPEQVNKIKKAYRVFSRKVMLEDGDYTMDHTAAVYMMSAKQNFVGTIQYGETHEEAMKQIKALIKQS
ncbi:SCO family protein [Polycladidibacter stylochi]|uniref:SCO family protein n=1 Tax=Polycladidibacter stylochi TaxID=1807766 RepID=UPI00082B0E20|nr:SCO family protein [Pseudovibrio stylochi]